MTSQRPARWRVPIGPGDQGRRIAASAWRDRVALGLIDASAGDAVDRECLERFEERLSGAPIAGAWAPGASDDHCDALLLPLGIDLPDEARTWWCWHNGIRADAPVRDRPGVPRPWPISADRAAELYEELADDRRLYWGLDGLLDAFGNPPRIYFGCAGPRDQPVPIYVQEDVETPTLVLPSIRALVLAWLEGLDLGVYGVDADGGFTATPRTSPPRHLLLGIW